MGNKKSIGLPGGPNEFLQDITQYISVDGYRRDSVDKTNPVNFIPSGDISMKDVDFPIMGTDNLGNSQMMLPENEYQFPGDMVMEVPQAQFGFSWDKLTNPLRKNLADNLWPVGYHGSAPGTGNGPERYGPIRKFTKALFGNPDNSINRDNNDIEENQDWIRERKDLLQMAMGFDQKNNSVPLSKYKPTKSKDKDVQYYSSPYTEKIIMEQLAFAKKSALKYPDEYVPVTGQLDIGNDNFGDVLGQYTIDEGEDDRGKYISYYDKWDLQPFEDKSVLGIIAEYGQDAIGIKTPEIYGRIYYDEIKKYGGGNLPEKQLGGLVKLLKAGIKQAPKYMDDITTYFKGSPKEAIYRGVYLNDEIRNSAKFAGKTDDEILEIMGTQIPGGNNTYRKAQFNQTMNFGRNFDEAAEHIRKYTNPNSIFKIGNTDDLINGQKYVLKVNPNPELDFMSAKQQKDLYYETLANFKKANPSSGVVTPNAAKDFNFQNYFDSGRARSFGPDLPIRSEGMNVIDGNFPQFIGNEGSVMGKLLEAIPIKQQAGEIRQYEEPGFFEKAGDILANPVTAFGYSARNENIPDRLNVNNTERSAFDSVIDMINPFAWNQYAENANANYEKGEYLDAGLDALSAIPIVPAWMSKGKNLKGPIKEAIKKVKDVIKPVDDMVEVFTSDGSKKLMKKADAIRLNRIEDANVNSKTFTNYEDGNWFSDEIQPFYLNNAKNTLKGGLLNPADPKRVMSAYLDPNDAKLFDVSSQGTSTAKTMSGGTGNLPLKGEYVLPPALVKIMREGTSGPGFNTMIGNSESIMKNLDAFYKKLGGGVYQEGGSWRDIDVNIEGVKKAIAQAESLGGKLMKNTESTASGLYGQRFSELDKYDLYEGTRDEFIADKDAQERIFNMRLNEGLVSKKGDTITTPLLKDAYDLTIEYKDQLGDNWDYSYEDIINLSNFIGRGGTRKYFGDVIRDGKKLEDVYPKLFGPNAKQSNKTPEEYLKISREFYKEGGSLSKAQFGWVGGKTGRALNSAVAKLKPTNWDADIYASAENKDKAFAQARSELGPGKEFLYDGVRYKTDYYGETEDKGTSELLERFKDEPFYDKFVDLWNQVGQPPLNIGADKTSFLGRDFNNFLPRVNSFYDLEGRRDHVNVYKGDNPTWVGHDNNDNTYLADKFINELTHVYQARRDGSLQVLLDLGTDALQHGRSGAYTTDNTMENEAHSILADKFRNYVFGPNGENVSEKARYKTRYTKRDGGSLPKGQYGNREVLEARVDNTRVATPRPNILSEEDFIKDPIIRPEVDNPFGSYAAFDPSEFEVAQDNTYVQKRQMPNYTMDDVDLSNVSIEEISRIMDSENREFADYTDPVLIADFIKKSNYYAKGWKDMNGASEEEIKDLQEVLLSKGYDIGATGVDGDYGNRTYAAHRAMVDDSNLDPTSVSRYYKNYSKDTYDEVKGIQNILVTKGYMNPLLTNKKSSSIDGKFGDQTKNALDAYNTDNFEEDPKATVFNNIPSNLDEPRCAAGMCNILEGNGILTEAIGVKYKDAWDLFESMEGADNSTSIYNIYDSTLFDNVDKDTPIELLKSITGKAKNKSQTKASDYKIGDIVGLYWQGSSHHAETLNSKTHNTHSGFVSNIVDGVPIITHNVNGKVIQQPYNELSTAWIRRPSKDVKINSKYEITDDINKIGADELAIINLETKYNSRLSNERRNVVENILQRATYNSTKIPEILNSSVDPAWLKSATFGITGVESGVGYNAPRTITEARQVNSGLQGLAYDIAGKEDSGISLGIGKTKFASLDKFARQYFDINSPEDLADDNKAVDAVSYILTKNYELFKDYAKQYPSLGLTEQDIRNMAILSYNQGSNRLIGTGRVDDERTPEEEIAALRALYEGTSPDISSTKYRFGNKIFDGLGDTVYNAALAVGLEEPGEQYISKVNGYIEDIFPQQIAMTDVDPFQVTTMAQGGEYGVFKNYIKGDYDGTKREVYAKGLYDKLNRKHYRQAKLAGMSPANYIMTNLVGNS